MADVITRLEGSVIQHGKENDRIYLMKLKTPEVQTLLLRLQKLAESQNYSKIFAKIPLKNKLQFENQGYVEEASVPGFYRGKEDACFMAKYLNSERENEPEMAKIQEILENLKTRKPFTASSRQKIRPLKPSEAFPAARIYRKVFQSYPFPVFDPDYLLQTMNDNVLYFGAEKNQQLVALSSSEMDEASLNAEMTDFATLPDFRRQGIALELLKCMEQEMKRRRMKTLYTIARALSPGMNAVFAKAGYQYSGTLKRNTQIGGTLESMNVWYKPLSD